MWMAQPKPESSLFVVILAILFVTAILVSLVRASYLSSKALNRWADEHGYKIIQKRGAGPFKHLSVGASSTQMVYDVIILDQNGSTLSGLIKLGHYSRLNLSSVSCPIEVYLDYAKKPDRYPEL